MPSNQRTATLYLQPKGSRPLRRTATLTYSTTAELRRKVEGFARTVWPKARKIDADTSAREIIIDGTPVANYVLNIDGEPAAPEPILPRVSPRRAWAGNRFARHTAAQLAVVILGISLAAAAGPAVNSLYLAGYALAGFGLYRLAHTLDLIGSAR